MRKPLAALVLISLLPAIARAQPADATIAATTSFAARANELPTVLNRKAGEEAYFAPSFLKLVPAEQVRAITAQLVEQFGAIMGVTDLMPTSAVSGSFKLRLARGIATVDLTTDAAAPYLVIGLRIRDVLATDDSLEKIGAAFRSLPGKTSYTVARLDPAGPTYLTENGDRGAMPIGSAFKLYILAELVQQVKSGKRHWSDVVPLDHRSLPSGISQDWPTGTPVTLATLATLMISISDNSATDTLLFVLGRDAVEARLAKVGNSATGATLPFLSTVEAFALKAPANSGLRDRLAAASEPQQRRLIDAAGLTLAQVDPAAFSGKPAFIDSVEWFASGRDMVRLLDHLNREADPSARAILAINPGVRPGTAARWQWLGYKGGSEPGVMHMSFIACAAAKPCYAITGSWSNVAAAVDEAAFAELMTRLLNVTADL